MTTQEAKKILSVYRPGAADAHDPDFAEALALARHDPGLKRWLDEQHAVHNAIRAQFKQIAPPAGLKEQIISEHKARAAVVWWRQPALLAAAASVAVLVAIAATWMRAGADRPEQENFATYRKRMVSQVLRSYPMTLESGDANQIRAHLAQRQAPGDYVLPEALDKTPLAGCGVLNWREQRVAMVCFRTGRPLDPGEKSDLFLFVVDRNSLPGAPSTRAPEISQVKRLVTASWSAGDKIYVLAMPGDEASIRKYF